MDLVGGNVKLATDIYGERYSASMPIRKTVNGDELEKLEVLSFKSAKNKTLVTNFFGIQFSSRRTLYIEPIYTVLL